jgi:serine acetyltransferase
VSGVGQDWRANSQARIRVALVLFRLAQATRRRLGRRHPLALATALLHHAFATAVVGFELPVSVAVGPGLTIWHGFGIVVNSGSTLGANVALRHGVTIGDDGRRPGCPVIEDGVEIGTGATVLGAIRVGANARIGAHALVLDDVPANGRARAPRAEIDSPRSAE